MGGSTENNGTNETSRRQKHWQGGRGVLDMPLQRAEDGDAINRGCEGPLFLGRSSKVRKRSSPLRPMGCGGNDPRDFRVIYLGAIGRRRVAPDMGAVPVHASLVLTGTAGAAADRPCYRLSSSPPRLLACRFLFTHRYIAASHYQGRARRRESWAWVFAH